MRPSQATAGGMLPTGPGFLQLVQATWLSWKQLVTISVPVGGYQALLVPPYILVLLAVVVTVSIALRSRVPEFAALPPVLLLVAGILLGSSVAAVPLWQVLGLLALLLAWQIRLRLRRRAAAVRTLREQTGLFARVAHDLVRLVGRLQLQVPPFRLRHFAGVGCGARGVRRSGLRESGSGHEQQFAR